MMAPLPEGAYGGGLSSPYAGRAELTGWVSPVPEPVELRAPVRKGLAICPLCDTETRALADHLARHHVGSPEHFPDRTDGTWGARASWQGRDAHRTVLPTLDWMDDALCADTPDPEVFFPERGEWRAVEAAKAICARCPVTDECRSYALATDHSKRWGIWAGQSSDRLRRAS